MSKIIRRILLASRKERMEAFEEHLDYLENEMRITTIFYQRRMTVLLNERTQVLKALTKLHKEERSDHEDD